MPDSSDYLPNAPSGWNSLVPITHGNPLSQENEFYFAFNYLPSSKFDIVNAYANTTIDISGFDFSGLFLSLMGFPIGGTPNVLSVNLRRRGSWRTSRRIRRNKKKTKYC